MNRKVIKIKTISVFFFLIVPIVIGIRKRKAFIELTMRIFILLFCTTLLGLTPKPVHTQNDKIVIAADQEFSVDQIFKIIKAQTDYRFIYYGDLFKDYPKVTLKKGIIRLNTLLNQSLSTDNLSIIFTKNKTILIRPTNDQRPTTNQFQQHIVSGTVTDQSGVPIAGVTILIKGSSRGVVTNFDGQYNISVPNSEAILVFSFLGFKTQEITVGNHLPAGLPSQGHGQAGTTINISLKEAINELDAVVLVGNYYKRDQRENPGSIYKIDAKTIEKQPVSNPIAAMQGYIPGVNITQDSGNPGSGFNIQVRGQNSLRTDVITDPLYIVDGVPYNTDPLGHTPSVSSILTYARGRNRISPLNLINPSNIESIEVLKDADATAIYGSRGANGVVLITTKKGKSGKTTVNLNMSTSLASVSRFVDLMNTEQFLEMRLEALANDGFTLETAPDSFKNNNPDLYEWDPERYTDWQDLFIGGIAYRNTAELSFSGGSEQTQFLFSGAYQNETTVFPGDSKYGKASVRSHINHQSADKRFAINVNMSYTADDKILPPDNLTFLSYQLAPNAPALYDDNGNLNWENSTWQNPLALLENKFRTQSNNVLLNTVLSYQLKPSLTFKTNLGYTDYRIELYHTQPHTSRDPAFGLTSETSSLVYMSNSSSKSWIVEPQLHWKTDWNKASFSLMVGTTFQQRKSKETGLLGNGFASNSQILNLSAANGLRVSRDEDIEYKYQALFGRLNFKWADTYIVNLTGRRDGSSRFGPGRQFGNFGAVGIAWLFSKEAFLKDNGLLNFGKLRSSYGITGSDNIGDYGFFDSYTTASSNLDYDGSGLEPARLFNPVFQWETNKKFEVALELGLFQDRIFLTTAWYKNRSANQLIGIPLPETTGFTSINANFDATVQNTGIEVDFRSVNIQKKDFKWTTIFNISIPRNKLVKFDDLESSTFRFSYVIGQPITIRRLYHNTGVDPDTGQYQFEDYNNDGVINSDDRQWLTDTAPEFYGGLGNTLNYKNWTLDVFFQFKKHRVNISPILATPGAFGNAPTSVLNRWQQVGDQTTTGRYTLLSTPEENTIRRRYESSNAVYPDASFIRLRNVNLSYTLPKAMLPGMDVSIYLHGQNLLTFTDFIGPDPDQVDNPNGILPILRQFSLGLQLGF